MNDSFIDLSGGFDDLLSSLTTQSKPEAPKPAAPTAKAADPAEAPAVTEPEQTDTPAPLDENEDINREMTDDEIHSSLQSEWGDQYEDRFAAASRVVGEIFHNDEPLLKWFEARVGNHINVVRLADRLSAMLDGNRPARSTAPNTAALNAELKKFEKGGEHFDAWMAGSKFHNDLRIKLYSQRYKGKYVIE